MNAFAPTATAATFAAAAALLALPQAAQAQAYRCPDPATGKVLYTDQPCSGGTVIAPRLSEEDQAQQAAEANAAREREDRRQEQAFLREQQRQNAQYLNAQQRALNAPAPHQTAECRAAREAADFRARSVTASEEEIRTARYTAALACGQQPPADVVVVQPEPVLVAPPVVYSRPYVSSYGPAYGATYGATYGNGVNVGVGVYGGTSTGGAYVQPRPTYPYNPSRFGVPVQTTRGAGLQAAPGRRLLDGMDQSMTPIPVRTNP